MKRTPLYALHESLGAKIAPFGGYDMPIQYTGILEEHLACRTGAAIFDVCHMGELFFSGPTALQDLEKLISCPVASLEIGQCRYGFLCNEEGGVIDDQIIYRLGEDHFMMVVNSATRDNDVAWITQHLQADTFFEDLTESTAKIDVQGPLSPKIVEELVEGTIADLTYFRAKHTTIKGVPVLVSRTGYTGEVGFELYFSADHAESLWQSCVALGAIPAGLGARDTLRLEMGMPLYGHELNEEIKPTSTGYDSAIDLTKEFLGSRALLATPPTTKMVGILLEGRQKPQDGESIIDSAGTVLGSITSGGYAPSLEKGVALAYLTTSAQIHQAVQIERKRANLTGTVVALPFYKEATARKKMSTFLS